MPLDILPSVCPHDCPGACALEVERIDARRIGRIRGARSQTYTTGIVCAKVGRYAVRQHHPGRLTTPLRRVGDKGVGRAAFRPIAWDDALDIVREGRPTALVYPAALARLGLADGGVVRIGNAKGSVVVHARAFAGLQHRVVVVEGLWPDADFAGGVGINLLTSAEPASPRGGAVFHDTGVWLAPA